eukprot:3574657-Amphidinium_carterae.1
MEPSERRLRRGATVFPLDRSHCRKSVMRQSMEMGSFSCIKKVRRKLAKLHECEDEHSFAKAATNFASACRA